MELKNINLFAIKDVIGKVSNEGDNSFKLKLMLNEELISDRIEKLEKLREFSEKFKEFQSKYQEMAVKHAEVDENGQPKLYNQENGVGELRTDGSGIPNIVKDIEEYRKSKLELEDEYKHFIDEAEENNQKFNNTLLEVIDPKIEFIKIPFENFPEIKDDNWYNYMKILKPLIDL